MTYRDIDDRRIAEEDWVEFESRLSPEELVWIHRGDQLETHRLGLEKNWAWRRKH